MCLGVASSTDLSVSGQKEVKGAAGFIPKLEMGAFPLPLLPRAPRVGKPSAPGRRKVHTGVCLQFSVTDGFFPFQRAAWAGALTMFRNEYVIGSNADSLNS